MGIFLLHGKDCMRVFDACVNLLPSSSSKKSFIFQCQPHFEKKIWFKIKFVETLPTWFLRTESKKNLCKTSWINPMIKMKIRILEEGFCGRFHPKRFLLFLLLLLLLLPALSANDASRCVAGKLSLFLAASQADRSWNDVPVVLVVVGGA